MSAASKKTQHDSDTIWVLTDASSVHGATQTLLPAAPLAVDVEKLGEQLQEFVIAFSKSLDKLQDVSVNGYYLSQVSVDVKLTATLGVVLIGQAGLTGGITLTFARNNPAARE